MAEILRKIRKGLRNPLDAVSYINRKVKRTVSFTISSRFNTGHNLMEEDWDLLIILDTCRVDVMREVAEEGQFEFLDTNNIREITSVGSSTPEWTTKTFSEKYSDILNETAYIIGHGYPYKIIENQLDINDLRGVPYAPTNWQKVQAGDFGKIIPAFEHSDRELLEQRHSDTQDLVDAAINIGRTGNYSQVIVHFIEPHYPYIASALSEGRELTYDEENPIQYLREGGDRDRVWENYKNELRHGLSYVEQLLKNFDAERVVISADHGEAFGERTWPGLRRYGHQAGMFHPKVRKVPLVSTSAVDTRNRESDISLDHSIAPENVTENLKRLGYLEDDSTTAE